ncbi:hypothetical protein [Tautonia sociabilis]|uniref:Uncharacterized protein n=1 Tax=Tautonia sociabilis TaxID=2080755 RepID=A0A432MII3_9BACT|nr:hypothetical protein [Tautonia sociabilis]RUL87171.1 hypothetical protein TsocGM_13925 [Tautonia sociabilis]
MNQILERMLAGASAVALGAAPALGLPTGQAAPRPTDGLGIVVEAEAPGQDGEVVPAGHSPTASPSAQQMQAPPSAPPKLSTVPQAAPPVAIPQAPPAMTQAVPAFVPQMAVPMTMPQMGMVPAVGYAPQVSAPMSANFFLPPAQVPASGAGMIPMTTAPMPMMTMPMMAVPMMTASPAVLAPAAPAMAAAPAAAAPAAGVAAVTNQTVALSTSASRTRVRVRGPGLIASSLARLGERLTALGRTRIETVQETEFASPLVQNAGGGLATFSTTSAAPIPSPPQQYAIPTAAPPPQEYCPPPPAVPSPQDPPPHRHLFGKHAP